jgi:hypothetical protein
MIEIAQVVLQERKECDAAQSVESPRGRDCRVVAYTPYAMNHAGCAGGAC